MKIKILILLSLGFANIAIGQNEAMVEFEQFKKFLPHVMKMIKQSVNESKTISTKVEYSEFTPPWELEKFSVEEIKTIIDKIQHQSEIKLIEGYNGQPRISILSYLQDFDKEPKVKERFSNLTCELSNFNILNEHSQNIHVENKKNSLQSSKNDIQEVRLFGMFKIGIPISQPYQKLQGSIAIVIKEKMNFEYKMIAVEDKLNNFKLGTTVFEVIKIENNKAIFKSNQKLNDLEIFSTNNLNQKHTQISTLAIPEDIYLKSLALDEEEIKTYARDYSFEDYSSEEQPYLYIYTASGEISKVGLSLNEINEVGKFKLELK